MILRRVDEDDPIIKEHCAPDRRRRSTRVELGLQRS
jgi:hypothetical protein